MWGGPSLVGRVLSVMSMLCLRYVVLLECITSSTDSMKFNVRLLDKTSVIPCYKESVKVVVREREI